MDIIKFIPLAALALSAALLSSATLAQAIRIDGASPGSALSKTAADEFQKTTKRGVAITLGTSGSAGGLHKLCKGEIDLANASRPILKEEMAACRQAKVEFIELPVALDAITVVVNPKNDFVSSLTLNELKRTWEADAQGKIVRWSQINSGFPNAPLKLLAPDSRFELTSTFNEVVLGRGAKGRGDYMASVDDNVLVQGVARDANTLSYVPYATYLDYRAKLRAVPIAGGAAESPSPEAGVYGALARPLFLYANVKSLENPVIWEFVVYLPLDSLRFAPSRGAQRGRELNITPIVIRPAELQAPDCSAPASRPCFSGELTFLSLMHHIAKAQP